MQAILKFVAKYKTIFDMGGRDTAISLLYVLVNELQDKKTSFKDFCLYFSNNSAQIRFNFDSCLGYLQVDKSNNTVFLTDSFYRDFGITYEERHLLQAFSPSPNVIDITTPRTQPTIILADDNGDLQEVVLAKPNEQVSQPQPQAIALPIENKPIELINNTKALSTLTSTLMQTADKSAKGRKSAPKQTANQVGSTNPSVVALELFDELYRNKFDDLPPPKHSLRDKKAMAELCDHYGGKSVSDTIQWFFANYDALKSKYKWEYPSISLFNGFRNTIFPLATKKEDVNTNPQWGSHHNDKNDRKDGDEIGFGFGDDDE